MTTGNITHDSEDLRVKYKLEKTQFFVMIQILLANAKLIMIGKIWEIIKSIES